MKQLYLEKMKAYHPQIYSYPTVKMPPENTMDQTLCQRNSMLPLLHLLQF